MANYYEILGVSRDDDEKTIKMAYRRLALKWHPDKNPKNQAQANHRFTEIVQAYEVLSTLSKRLAYNNTLNSTQPAKRANKNVTGFQQQQQKQKQEHRTPNFQRSNSYSEIIINIQYKDGKKIYTHRTIKNDLEIKKVYINGHLVSKTVEPHKVGAK